MSDNTRTRIFMSGFALGGTLAAIAVFLVTEYLTMRNYRKILIEHGAAYYKHDTGEFTLIRIGEDMK